MTPPENAASCKVNPDHSDRPAAFLVTWPHGPWAATTACVPCATGTVVQAHEQATRAVLLELL